LEYDESMKNQRKTSKLKNGAWFYKVRGSYLPATWQGWLTYFPFVGFLLWSWGVAMETQETLGEVALVVFPSWVAAAVVMTWIASKKS
jgi:hypothetical protein